jgi:two-component system OmpR family response regulator/two-component system copper resistance phosphate regulon response regulator CusR
MSFPTELSATARREAVIMKVLVIEDDLNIGKSVQKGLSEAGHDCTWIRDGKNGLVASRTQKFDAIVLDLLLPNESGLGILEKIRGQGINTPVIVVTALGSVQDKIAGLKMGADDYLVKPFDMAELIARIDAVCRRTTTKPAATLEAGALTLDLTTRRVTWAGSEIDLTPTEFSILEMLMRYHGLVVTRRMICESLWTSDWEGTTNVIEVHINRLRNKLQKVNDASIIHTVRGRGYALRVN